MTNLTENAMTDADEKGSSNTQRNLWMVLCGLGIIMLLGAIAGFLSQHSSEGGGSLDRSGIGILSIFVTVILVLAFAIWKLDRQKKRSGERMSRREQLNNRVIWGCGLVGGFIGLTLAFADTMGANDGNIFGNGALPPVVAIILSVVIGLVLPAVTFYWHKHVVDEQEDAAYRAGAVIAIYAFWFVAPVWWLLWRCGVVPSPNGVALYLMTTFVALIVWSWKKYR